MKTKSFKAFVIGTILFLSTQAIAQQGGSSTTVPQLDLEKRTDINALVGTLPLTQKQMAEKVRDLLLRMRARSLDYQDVDLVRLIIARDHGQPYVQIYDKYFLQKGWVQYVYVKKNINQRIYTPITVPTSTATLEKLKTNQNTKIVPTEQRTGGMLRLGQKQRGIRDDLFEFRIDRLAALTKGEEITGRGLFGQFRGIGLEVGLSGSENFWKNGNVTFDTNEPDKPLYGEQFGSLGSIKFYGDDGRFDINFSSKVLTQRLGNGNQSGFLTNPETQERVPVNFVEVNTIGLEWLKYPSNGRSGVFCRAGVNYNEYKSEKTSYGAAKQLGSFRSSLYDLQESERINDKEFTGAFDLGYQMSALDGRCILRPEVGIEVSSFGSDYCSIRFGAEAVLRTRKQDQIPKGNFYADLFAKMYGNQYVNGEIDAFFRTGVRTGLPISGSCRLDFTGEAIQALSLSDSRFIPIDSTLAGIRDDDPIFSARVQFIIFW